MIKLYQNLLFAKLIRFGITLAQEPIILKLSEDQMAQLLSSFWVQANLPDNLPSNIQAIAHSFMLTLTALRIKVDFLTVILTASCQHFLLLIRSCTIDGMVECFTLSTVVMGNEATIEI